MLISGDVGSSRASRSAVVFGLLCACAGGEEAARVELPLRADARHTEPVVTDLGYEIQLSEARLMLADLEFAIGGEAHAAGWLRRLGDAIVPPALAHPGHATGGEVTGELRGRFVASWLPESGTPLGMATLLTGDYESANFTLSRAGAADGLAPGDPLLGHTAILRGSATRSGARSEFVALLDGEGELAGVPFAVPVRTGMAVTLGLELLPRDPFEGDTLFDGIDFEALGASGQVVDISRAGGDAATRSHETLLERLSAPDHFRLSSMPQGELRATP